MKINEDNESFRGVPQHFWGVMTVSDSNELANFTPDYAEACFGVDAGPASCSGGQWAAAPAAATASAGQLPPSLQSTLQQVWEGGTI